MQITFEKTKATGVVFYRNNTRHEVKATKEVILSAGAIGSAQILMLSGVGPKAHLDEMKVGLNFLMSTIEGKFIQSFIQ